MSSNLRHQILNIMLYLPLLVGVMTSWSVLANTPVTRGIDFRDHITQLERIVNAHSQLLMQLQQNFLNNQAEIDSLRGQIQENQYQINQIIEYQKRLILQIDRLNSVLIRLPIANKCKLK